MKSVIYSIAFSGGSRRYIGSALDLRNRLAVHKHRLRNGTHHSVALQRAANKYGLAAMSVDVLETVSDPGQLLAREQIWIDRYWGKLYNCSPSASSRLGAKMPEKAKARISASLLGNSYRTGIPHDAAARTKISNGLKANYASGGREPVNCPENLAAFNAAVASGERNHPSRNAALSAAVTESHARTRSPSQTGEEFGISPSAVLYHVRRTNPSQIRKWSRTCATQ